MMKMTSPTLHDLCEAIGGRLSIDGPPPYGQPLGPIATDSRRVNQGDLFWALRGPSYDGNDYVNEAFERGAAGAIVARPTAPPAGRWAIEVHDTQPALWNWAQSKRRRFTGTLIAVTGSVGKTTTRQMIHTVLRRHLKGTASPRNYNNYFGVPLSMLAVEPDHDYAVLELGASSRGEIAALADLCAPKIGVITHVGDAHLGGFGSRRGVAEAKAELLASLPPDGHAVLVDDPFVRRVAGRCRAPIAWVGRGTGNDVMADEVASVGGQLEFQVAGCPFRIPVWGRHHLNAALAAVAVGRLLGLDLPEMADALSDFNPVPMRCEVLDLRGATVINDAYNANPASMRAALELVRDFDTSGRRIIVCGDMAELGDESTWHHFRLGRDVVTVCGADLLIACGQFARPVVDGARAAGMPTTRTIPCATPEEALPYLGQAILPGDVVLVKGSRSMNMERVIEAFRCYPRRRRSA
ncbi:MAG: UDP-N-acetylmuramoyl-tripeptide--D-alanyl-D-alanine ligase [Pirellulales bacterium]|nr:UDP-N-acetylmuramoyl-tripeptide--D-alanyl-D-alanine ligase [Pirellulales bacterium]